MECNTCYFDDDGRCNDMSGCVNFDKYIPKEKTQLEVFEAVKRVRDNCQRYEKDCPFCRFSGVCQLLL